MNWIKFSDGTHYTFARDIQKFAESQGYKVPRDNNGNSHPGTDCNTRMRTIMKDAGMRKSFNIDITSVVDVYIEDCEENQELLKWLTETGILGEAYKKHKVIQLYRREAVSALLSTMLKVGLEYVPYKDKIWEYNGYVLMSIHNFELKKNKPKASLFKQ